MFAAWLKFQQDLALAAFVAGCSVAELQLRLVEASMPARRRPARIRLVSDFHGILIEGPSP